MTNVRDFLRGFIQSVMEKKFITLDFVVKSLFKNFNEQPKHSYNHTYV